MSSASEESELQLPDAERAALKIARHKMQKEVATIEGSSALFTDYGSKENPRESYKCRALAVDANHKTNTQLSETWRDGYRRTTIYPDGRAILELLDGKRQHKATLTVDKNGSMRYEVDTTIGSYQNRGGLPAGVREAATSLDMGRDYRVEEEVVRVKRGVATKEYRRTIDIYGGEETPGLTGQGREYEHKRVLMKDGNISIGTFNSRVPGIVPESRLISFKPTLSPASQLAARAGIA